MYEKKNSDLKLFVESRKKTMEIKQHEVTAKKSAFGKAIEERNIVIKSKEDMKNNEDNKELLLPASNEDKEEFVFPPLSMPSVDEENDFPPSQTVKSLLVKRNSPEKEINEEDVFQDKEEFFFPDKKKSKKVKAKIAEKVASTTSKKGAKSKTDEKKIGKGK
jgi:hypothetical protein